VPRSLVSVVCSLALLQAPGPLSLFTYSRDSVHGFKDELLDTFRRELSKHVDSFAEVAYSREEAQVSVQFLGQGDLTVELGDAGEPLRYLWRTDANAPRTWALVRVARKGQLNQMGSFSKEFSVDGVGGRDLSRLAKSIADWIRENETAIRDR
jgi:hypothetical protein